MRDSLQLSHGITLFWSALFTIVFLRIAYVAHGWWGFSLTLIGIVAALLNCLVVWKTAPRSK